MTRQLLTRDEAYDRVNRVEIAFRTANPGAKVAATGPWRLGAAQVPLPFPVVVASDAPVVIPESVEVGVEAYPVACTRAAWGLHLWLTTGPADLGCWIINAAIKAQVGLSVREGLLDTEGRPTGDGSEAGIALAIGPELQSVLDPAKRSMWVFRMAATRESVETGEVRLARSSSGETNYEVLVDRGVEVHCTCKGFTYRGACRHLDEAVLAEPVPVGGSDGTARAVEEREVVGRGEES